MSTIRCHQSQLISLDSQDAVVRRKSQSLKSTPKPVIISQKGLWGFVIQPSAPENQVSASQVMYCFKQCGPLGILLDSWAV